MVLAFVALLVLTFATWAQASLEQDFDQPPTNARLRAYWWWLNGNVTKAAITHDLEQMKAKGFSGAVLVDADGSNQGGNDRTPHGPTFFSPAWRELYQHTLREANRLGLEISLNIQSGWNLGGPPVRVVDAVKKLVWSETLVTGPIRFNATLPEPSSHDNFYRDTMVLAYRLKDAQGETHRPLQNFDQKALFKTLQPFSAPDTAPLFAEFPATPGEEDARVEEVIDLTAKLSKNSQLDWNAPPGRWQVLRFGYTVGDHARVSTSSEGWSGYALDVLDAGAFQRYWDAIVEPLIKDAGPLAGPTLKYLFTDSWEIEAINWTPSLPKEFRQRRGYDLLPWLPVLAGRIINSREESDLFLADFRKTIGDLTIDHHYRLYRDNAHRHGLGIHPESGGPHPVPIDAQRCLGWDDAPMSEFWAWSWEHRIGDENRFFVKQPASAAHTYGHKLVMAEGFTDLGPHWQESLWSNLKPSFDHALCEGLNVLVWHAFVCSPDSTGIPGQQYFAGTHLNPKVTWWDKSGAFFSYINRCQAMMQEGLPFADVLYYYGDHVPNFTQLKKSDPAHVLPGYDYDVITEEALLERTSVKDGRIMLPDGLSYRVLVLPNRNVISLPVLRRLKELAAAGATIVGPKPSATSTLSNFPKCDTELKGLAEELWGDSGNAHPFGQGRVISGKTAREVLTADGVPPDFEINGAASGAEIDYIHRQVGDADIYFVANRTNQATAVRCTFRVAGKAPEIWDAVTGQRKFAEAYEAAAGRTSVPLEFTPCGSCFVIFRDAAAKHPSTAKINAPTFEPVQELNGPWTVKFDPKWGGPASAQFTKLSSWTDSAESGVKYYSGTATYWKNFDFTAAPGSARIWLDLGEVRELASVRLNGRDLGIVWAPPFRVDITDAVKPTGNQLEIAVVNFWPNRIIGDASLPKGKHFTKTNIRKLTKSTPLMPSGLLGPVRLFKTAP